MFKLMHHTAWAFDAEWIPDVAAGCRLYGLPETLSDGEVMQEMWKHGGATEDDPMPYLKTVICRVVSISAVTRTVRAGDVTLHLLSLPRDCRDPAQAEEAHVVGTFLEAVGKHKPQLVGYNSIHADLRILVQRAVANGLQAPDFCRRPNKPWEGVDYFARGSDYNVDLSEVLGGWGKSTPSLNEMATVSGIPGKITGDGQSVAPLWLDGHLDQIVAYNEFDALTTYLVWLRTAHFAGFLSPAAYTREQELLHRLLETEAAKPERLHLRTYIEAWDAARTDA